MAKVEMDLSELRAIENQVEEQKEIVAQKENDIKDLNKIITELESNKKIVERIITTNELRSIRLNPRDLQSIIVSHTESLRGTNSREHYYESLATKLSEYLSEARFNMTSELQTKTNYINLDDVLVELRERAETLVQEELDRRKEQIRILGNKLSDIETIHKNEVDKIKADNAVELLKLKEENIKLRIENTRLLDRNMKLNEKEALEKKVQELVDRLEIEESKTWWDKLWKR